MWILWLVVGRDGKYFEDTEDEEISLGGAVAARVRGERGEGESKMR